MDTAKLNSLMTLIANLGVLAGIVFLGYELQQNNKQLELQSYQSWVTANLEINTALTDLAFSEVLAKGHQNSANLSNESYIAYAMHNMSMMQMAQSAHYLYKAGSLDRELWELEMSRAAGILALPGVRQWWDAGGKTQLTPSFAEFIESVQTNIDTWSWNKDRGFFTDNNLRQSSE